MAIRAFLSAFLSTSLPEYSFVIVRSIVGNIRKTPHQLLGRCGVFWCIALALVFALQADFPHRLLPIRSRGRGRDTSTTRSVARVAPLTAVSLMIRACIQCTR